MSTIKSSSEHLTLNADGSGKDIILQNNGSTKVTVKSDGNVGIGTASPAERLNVDGSVRVGDLKIQDSSGGRIGFNRNTANGAIYNSNYAAHQINGAFTGSDFLDIQSYSSTGTYEGSVVVNSGNVGIGTTSPTSGYKLDVNGKIIISQGDAEIRFNDGGGWIGNASATTNTVVIGTSGIERMRIDSAGRVTMPYQPAFSALNTTHDATGVLVFDDANVNVGSHYNTSNGRFTAPVAGQYMFHFYAMSSSTSDLRCRILINGAVYSGGEHQGGVGYAAGGVYNQVSINTMLTLGAGDYVHIQAESNYSLLHEHHNKFSGHLIG